jgi:hypothetical protein
LSSCRITPRANRPPQQRRQQQQQQEEEQEEEEEKAKPLETIRALHPTPVSLKLLVFAALGY